MLKKAVVTFIILLITVAVFAQNKASLYGQITNFNTVETLIGGNVLVRWTSLGSATVLVGNYSIKYIGPGEYSIDLSYIGYEKKLFTGINLSSGQNRKLDIRLKETVLTIDQDIIIIGQKPLVDINDPKNTALIDQDVLESAPAGQIQDVLNSQTGIVNNSEGIHIRGGRTYETGFFIDGVSAKDPLAGTGFGIDIGTNAVSSIEVNTSNNSVEYGDATSGTVNTKTRSGGDHFEISGSYKRDNLGFNSGWNSIFNQQDMELAVGGPVGFVNKKTSGKLHYFGTLKLNFTDEFTKNPADQLFSSLYPGSTSWTPYQDNRWGGMMKLNYNFSSTKKLKFSYLKSLNINQDFNMLRITGNDVPFSPGYQFNFQLQPDNANTYTHDTNLETLEWQQTVNNQISYKVTFSRLFVKLRADANGRDWRPEEVSTEFEPRSIVAYPSDYFNPDDSIVFINPGPGLYNNGGIATLWHDHFVEEYTLRASTNIYSSNTRNRLSLGMEITQQELQWIDITRPWIGAPIKLADGQFTQSYRLGDLSDVWHVKPLKGAFYTSDKIQYLGLIAEIGLRFEYWMPGKFVDDAIRNPEAPIRDEIRQSYLDHTVGIGNRRMKLRLLPKFSASFPIKENQMMYFNYSHSTISPHPSYIYTGLNPYFADRSTLARLGNPDLNPEVDISYELGLKSQITANDALNVDAFWKDKYDFITATSVLLEDVTGREVSRTIHINSDYARIRGIEVAYIKRIGRWFNGQISASYSIASGQSSSSSQSIQDILLTGNRVSTIELPLAWDSPLDIKAYSIFTINRDTGLFGLHWLNHFSAYVEAVYRTGQRYTPYFLTGYEVVSNRPIYEQDPNPDHRFQKLGASSFWLNVNMKKWWTIKKVQVALTFEITNVLNNKNTAIVNPVTGKAWEYGDPVPTQWRDPVYLDPRDPRSYNTPPDNPARYYEQRHFLIGINVKF